jgi:transcriptional regulator with XRE-family HTH domain
VAARLAVPQSFVSKYESGERRLDVVELRHVAEAIETTLDAIVSRLR